MAADSTRNLLENAKPRIQSAAATAFTVALVGLALMQPQERQILVAVVVVLVVAVLLFQQMAVQVLLLLDT